MKRILTVLFALTASASLLAGPVTREQAKSVAKSFLQAKGHSLNAQQPVHRAPRRGAKASDDNAYYYVFNADGGQGFVIVSGDDRTESVLGYSDTGAFDAKNVPCNLEALLEGYASQIKYLDDTNYSVTPERRKAAAKSQQTYHAVAPILTCLWNQGDPYNLKCPKWGDDGLCVTGCVATAIAQAMYHHKWPAQTIAEIPAYTDGNGHELEATAAGAVIDWDNITDTFTASSTDAQKEAISNLMLWVGKAVKMTYGSSSSALTNAGESVLPTIFDYDESLTYEGRDNYSADGWFKIIYSELDANRPVVYCGQSNGGGHAFVLDGYDGDGMFHVNWGWGGSSNGYFRIDVLAPGANAGIGASVTDDGYTAGQGAYINMKKPDGVTAEKKGACLSTFPTQSGNYNVNNDTKIFHVDYCNWSGGPNQFDTNAAYIDNDGNLIPFSTSRHASLGINGVTGQNYSLAHLPAGTYKIVPVSKLSTSEKWVSDQNTDIYYAEVNIAADGTITHTIHPIVDITATFDTSVASHKVSESQTIKMKFQNNGEEYYKTINFYVSQDADYMTGDNPDRTRFANVLVAEGGTSSISFSFTPSATGTWYLWAGTSKDNILASTIIEIGSETAFGYSLSETNFTINNLQSGSKFYGLILNGSVTVKNNGTQTFDHDINIELWHNEEGNDYYYHKKTVSIPTVIAAGESKVIPFNFTDLDDTHNYWIGAKPAGGASLNSYHYGYHTVDNSRIEYNQQGGISGTANSTYTAYNTDAAVDLRLATLTKATLTSARSNTTFYFAADADVLSAFNGKNVVKGTTAERITLTEGGGAFYAPYDFTAENISYSCTISTASDGKTNLQTICLPFTPTAVTANGTPISLGDIYVKQFTGLDDSGKVILEDAETMKSNIPYVIGVPAAYAGKTLVFSATNAKITATANIMMLACNNTYDLKGSTYAETYTSPLSLKADGTQLVAAAETAPFHAYFLDKTGTAGKQVNVVETPEPVVPETIDRSAIATVNLTPAKDIELRAPAVPLIANDPYFQVWSNGDYLNEQPTTAWDATTEKCLNGYLRVDGKTYQFMGVSETTQTLLGGAPKWDHSAYIITDSEPSGWYAEGATPSGWTEGTYGPFNNGDYTGWERTNWNDFSTKDLYVRRSFNLTAEELAAITGDLNLRIAFDQDPVIYINGEWLTSLSGWTANAGDYTVIPIAVSRLKEGENLIAIKAGRGEGGQFLDFMLESNPTSAITNATQNGLPQVLATQSHYSFEAGGVDLDLTFTNPQMADDLNKLATPIDYISYKVTPNDGQDHVVQVYLTAMPGEFADGDEPISTTRSDVGNMRYVKSGHLNIAAPDKTNHSDVSFGNIPVLNVLAGSLPSQTVGATTTSGQGSAIIFRDDLSLIRSGNSSQGYAVIGYDYDGKEASYLTPNYYTLGGTFTALLAQYADAGNYKSTMEAARAWDETIYDDAIAAGGKKYAEVASLAYRQTIAANIISLSKDNKPVVYTMSTGTEQKQQAVELAMAETPLLAVYNPSLLVGSLAITGSEDIQTTDVQADYILTAAAACKMEDVNLSRLTIPLPVSFSNDEALAKSAIDIEIINNETSEIPVYEKLKGVAALIRTSLNNGTYNLDSFDGNNFAAKLTGNKYVEAKGILALAAFAQIAEAAGESDVAATYKADAKEKAAAWLSANINGNHYTHASEAEWGLKYALVYDEILGTRLFDAAMQKEMAYYLAQTAGTYGLPMDARSGVSGSIGYTYATAAMADGDGDWATLTDPIWNYVNDTATRQPLRPYYDTTTAEGYADKGFNASPMVGWLWAKVLADKAPLCLNEGNDNSRTISHNDGLNKQVTLNRAFTANTWNTVCLPVSLNSTQLTELFGEGYELSEFTQAETNDGHVVLNFSATTNLQAGKPYIVNPTKNVAATTTISYDDIEVEADITGDTHDGVTFRGVYDATAFNENAEDVNENVLIVSLKNKTLQNPKGTGRLKPFRCYFQVPDGFNAAKASITINGETGIVSDKLKENSEKQTPVYNLQGQHVTAPTKGVYIQNGKKAVMK